MKRWLLLSLVLFWIAQVVSGSSQFRTQCCHGCGGYYCNYKNCGAKCNMGPSCTGCWKDCASQP